MNKLPPREKVPEAFTAIADGRISLQEGEAFCGSSDGKKRYHIRFWGDRYVSDDNASYWQGYPGYPVIAVLLLEGKLTLKEEAKLFAGINWHELNKKHKRNYRKAYEEVLQSLPDPAKADAYVEEVYQALCVMPIEIGRKL